MSARFCAFKESPRYQKTDGFHQPYGKKGFKYGGFTFEITLVIVKKLQFKKNTWFVRRKNGFFKNVSYIIDAHLSLFL